MKKQMIQRACRLFYVWAGLTLGLAVPTAMGEEDGNSGDLWKTMASGNWPVLYESDNGLVEEWRIQGRFDLQYGDLDSDYGDDDDYGIRRFRVGTRIKFLDHWRVKAVVNLINGSSVDYRSLDSAYIGYYPSKRLKFKLGKQSVHFGQEWSTPSSDLRVIERALLVQQVRPRKSTGMTVSGVRNQWDYEFGVFSGDWDTEFGDANAGVFYLATLGYDFTDRFDYWKKFDLRFSYLHNNGDIRNNGVEPYRDSFSSAIKLRRNWFRLSAEAIYAGGIQGRADVWGFLISPSWELIDNKLDLVLRYHFAKSDGRDGLRLRSRYETLAPDLTDRGRGEEYESLYLGLKHYILKDRLTFSAGVEWSDMEDHYGDGGDLSGISILSALRLDF